MSDLILVMTTVDSQAKALELANELVKLRLSACVQIEGPIQSVYRWKGEIESAEEFRVTAKTRRGVYNDVENAIRGHHDYDVPEIVALPVVAAADGYAVWLNEQIDDNPLRKA